MLTLNLLLASALALTNALAPSIVVDLVSEPVPSFGTKVSVQTCSGLLNRGDTSVYTLLTEPFDSDWLFDTEGVSNPALTSIDDFLKLCLADKNVNGYILYDYKAQQILVPNLVTLSSVLNAVLLEASSPAVAGATLVYDAVKEWEGFTGLDASRYMYEHYVNQTTTLAFMNPGYNGFENATNPPVTGNLEPGLIDYIVKERIFNFYLNDACIPNTEEYAFMSNMVNNNPWPRPIPVYGYDDTYPIAGDIFEAETDCTKAHNMGQIATSGVNNLAFYSRKPPITTPLPQNPVPTVPYNSSKTYVAFIMGDGDNVAFLKSSRRTWMKERVSRCAADPSYYGCFPLSWSISPHPRFFAPDWLHWYYNQSYTTTHDYFVLPPSGDLYSYPSQMPPDVQANYVSNTEADGVLLSTRGTVEWEWFGHWGHAVDTYFPLYDTRQLIRGFFAVNVPFNVPMIEVFRPGELYTIIGEGTVLFRPREWRGTTFSPNIPLSRRQYYTVAEQAAVLNSLAPGSVTYIYLTSDGGGNLDMIYDLVKTLDEHVLVVSTESLIDLALERG